MKDVNRRLFVLKESLLPLEGKRPSGMKEDEWKVLDRQALGVVRLTLAWDVAFNIKGDENYNRFDANSIKYV